MPLGTIENNYFYNQDSWTLACKFDSWTSLWLTTQWCQIEIFPSELIVAIDVVGTSWWSYHCATAKWRCSCCWSCVSSRVAYTVPFRRCSCCSSCGTRVRPNRTTGRPRAAPQRRSSRRCAVGAWCVVFLCNRIGSHFVLFNLPSLMYVAWL